MHISVLLKEVVENANVHNGDVVVDATVGAGGHTMELLEKVGAVGQVVAVDVDKSALEETEKRALNVGYQKKNLTLVNENFANIKKIIKEHCKKKPSAIIADLGWRIEQIKSPEYGMSFMNDAPLNMQLGKGEEKITAADIVSEWDEKQLSDLFWLYGHEERSKKIAREIIQKRKKEKITTTKQLADIATSVKGKREGKIHPATKVFQALRIVVNDEIVNLEKFIDGAIESLEIGGRLVIISFHSLEDKTVKNIFRVNAGGCVCPKWVPICTCGAKTKIKKITKKPIVPSDEELVKNPRSRSAKMRVVEKVFD